MSFDEALKDNELLKQLGERMGFGSLMTMAAHFWRQKLRLTASEGAEYTVGPAAVLTTPCGCSRPEHCDWCCGCGWLTLRVKSEKNKRRKK